MLKEINDIGPKLKEDDLISLEDKLGKKLPNDFQNFLLTYNGGSPVECEFDFDQNKSGLSGGIVNYFFGLKRKSDILNKLENLPHVVPKEMIPIGESPGGNLFLLSIYPNTYGNVFYKNHEIEDSFEFNDSNKNLPESMLLVANSFSDFLEKLYDPDE